MLAAIALTPSAPVLVPELAGAAAREVSAFRSAAIQAAATLPDQWIAIGVGSAEMTLTRVRGTFAGYGVDIPIALGPGQSGPVTAMPLCALFAGWLRGQANLQARMTVRVYPDTLSVDAALARGRALRVAIDEATEAIGLLVVADGANTLTQSAPGGYDPDAEAVQSALDDALASGRADALTQLPDGIIGRVAYQVLAGLTGSEPCDAHELLRGAPYGVGYFVGTWSFSGGSAVTREGL